MNKIFIFSAILSLAKAGLLISIGILISKHFDAVLSLLIRKPIPEDLISDKKLKSVNQLIKWIGIFIIIIGVGVAIAGIGTLITFNKFMSTARFNLNL